MSTQLDARPVRIGQCIGALRVIRLLGAGSTGTVFLAIDEQIGRRAAIKFLQPEHCCRPRVVHRFLNEARAVNLVRHPGLVSIFGFGQLPDGAAYIVMEYLKGQTLLERLRERRVLQLGEALRLGRQIASALAAAHLEHIVHRDLKPANVMIVPDSDVVGGERTKLFDFGVAKVAPPADCAGWDGGQDTGPRVLLGTPAYMAPEQFLSARDVDDRADVFALGSILFEMLSGTMPFRKGSLAELAAQKLHAPPPRLDLLSPAVPPGLGELVAAMLATSAGGRPRMAAVAGRLCRLWESAGVQKLSQDETVPFERLDDEALYAELLICEAEVPAPAPRGRAWRWLGGCPRRYAIAALASAALSLHAPGGGAPAAPPQQPGPALHPEPPPVPPLLGTAGERASRVRGECRVQR